MPYDLDRFVSAQASTYAGVIAELQAGRKTGHWIWFAFPQIAGLGRSEMSRFYALESLDEARAYLAHPLLGPRLIECAGAVLAIDGRSAIDIFGSPDDMKLRSSATLFARASPDGSEFHRILDKYFGGRADDKTLRLVGARNAGA